MTKFLCYSFAALMLLSPIWGACNSIRKQNELEEAIRRGEAPPHGWTWAAMAQQRIQEAKREAQMRHLQKIIDEANQRKSLP
jgi:hypothetical protein